MMWVVGIVVGLIVGFLAGYELTSNKAEQRITEAHKTIQLLKDRLFVVQEKLITYKKEVTHEVKSSSDNDLADLGTNLWGSSRRSSSSGSDNKQ